MSETLLPNWAGQFRTFQHWVDHASSYIDKHAVCIDAKGRRCLIGRDFMQARDDGAFPVRYFWDCVPAALPPPEKMGQDALAGGCVIGRSGFPF